MTAVNDSSATPAETPTEKPPSKPARKPPSPEQIGRQTARLDGVLVILVLVLAFFLSSFAARNSDLLMHLATGRLIAHGGYSFGVDPFAYTTAGTSWINHAWLFDLLLYGLAAAAGGIEQPAAGYILVGFKALLVVALAWVLLQVRRPGLSLWAPVFCTLLSLLAMSHGLELQPRVVSFLFLGLTLYLLVSSRTVPASERPTRADRSPRPGLPDPWRLWLLPPLVALWANFDSWFILGPLTVGVFWLGEGFQAAFDSGRFGEDKPQAGDLRRLLYVFLACVGAGLLNPHHLSGFAFPAEWAVGTRGALTQREAQALKSPSLLEGEYYRTGGPGRSVAGSAYFPLLLVSLVSFLLNHQGWRWSRAFLWVVFVFLSIRQASLIGFSAVVLGPIAALNLQEFALRRFGLTPFTDLNGRAWSLGGRTLTFLLGLVLLAGAWPGWLHAAPTDVRHDRRVAWRLDIEPSLRDAALQMQAWREDGTWADEQHGFLFHPDVAHYCAWFAPREKGFLDHRYPLFRDVATDFMKVRQALRGVMGKPAGTDLRSLKEAHDAAYENIFKKQQIGHVVVYFNENDDAAREDDTQRVSTAYRVMQWLLLQPNRWTPVFIKGRTVVFRWNEERQMVWADPGAAGQLDINRLAFGQHLEEKDRSPAVCPPWPNRRRSIWERYLQPEAPAPTALDEAVRWRVYYQQSSLLWREGYHAFGVFAANMSAAAHAGIAPGSLLGPAALNHYTRIGPNLLRLEASGPPAPLILALRAARRAVAANPESARAYHELATVCEMLWRQQEEPWNGQQLQMPIRRMQVLGALRQVLALRPDQDVIHAALGELYLQLNHPDLAVEHLRERLKAVKQAGPKPPTTPEQFQKAVEAQEKQLTQLESELKQVRNDYLVKAEGRPVLIRAQLALQRDLVKEALQVLLTADPKEIGPNEANVLANLLTSTGRLDEAVELLQPEKKALIGSQYELYRPLLAAALGNYKEAALYLDEGISQASKVRREALGHAVQVLSYTTWLEHQPLGRLTLTALNMEANRPTALAGILQAPFRYQTALQREAQFHYLRGLFALEEGDNAAAERHLQQAVNLSGSLRVIDGSPVAMRYLKLLQAARK